MDREAFFDAFWKELRAKGRSSVVLHSWKNLPQVIESDVDYAVSGCTPGELLRFLADFCRKRSWRLVQVIEHEPDAFFCVAMQHGGGFEQLALDVTWDYRRLGHHLLRSEDLQRGSRRIKGKSFSIPAPGVEACYILAKAAAKNKDFREIATRLRELIDENTEDCARALQERLACPVLPDTAAEACYLKVRQWYPDAPVFAPIRRGRRFGIGEVQLYLRRCLRPTGLWLNFAGAPSPDSPQMVEILKPIEPLFRRVFRSIRIGWIGIPKTFSRMVRTSLVIETGNRRQAGGEWRQVIDLSDGADTEELRRQILEKMAMRVERRISTMS
jgi:hypothetical protein